MSCYCCGKRPTTSRYIAGKRFDLCAGCTQWVNRVVEAIRGEKKRLNLLYHEKGEIR